MSEPAARLRPLDLEPSARLVVLGRTGDGKSSASNLLFRLLGGFGAPFAEGEGALAHTHRPVAHRAGGVEVVDTPGLMDPLGTERDEENIRAIVAFLRELRWVSAFVLVLNEEAPRLDKGILDAVKLFSDSFGPAMWSNVGVLFTRARGLKGASESLKYVSDEVVPVLRRRTGLPLGHLPSWQVDCHPEQLLRLGVPNQVVDQRQTEVNTVGEELLRWARALRPVDVSQCSAAEYAEQAQIREAREAEAAADRARQREAYLRRREETKRHSTYHPGSWVHGGRTWYGKNGVGRYGCCGGVEGAGGCATSSSYTMPDWDDSMLVPLVRAS